MQKFFQGGGDEFGVQTKEGGGGGGGGSLCGVLHPTLARGVTMTQGGGGGGGANAPPLNTALVAVCEVHDL